MILPYNLVLPSLNMIWSPTLTYSVLYMNLNLTRPVSPVLMISLLTIFSILTDYLMTLQCNWHWYPSLIVVEWCNTNISASKYHDDYGFNPASNMNIPFLKSFLCIFQSVVLDLTLKHANWPGCASSITRRFTWIDLMTTGLNWFYLSGPNKTTLLTVAIPVLTNPLTTTPTPGTMKLSFRSNSNGWLILSSYSSYFWSNFPK